MSGEQSALHTGRVNKIRAAARSKHTALVREWTVQLRRAPARARIPTAHVPSTTAYAVVLGMWAIFFGVGVISAVRLNVGDDGPPSEPITLGSAITGSYSDLARTATCVWLISMLAYRYGLTRDQLGWPTRPRRARLFGTSDGFRLGVLYALIIATESVAMGALRSVVGGAEYPAGPPSGWPGIIDAAASSIAAGVIEELVLVAVLVTFLEAARQPSWAIYAAAIVVRVSFHLYYAGQDPAGLVSVLPILAWAAAAVALFRWTRLVIPLIVVHALWDFAVSVALNIEPEWQGWVGLGSEILILVGVGIYVAACWIRQRRAARAALQPLVADTAKRFGVSAPRLRMAGQSHPEVFRGHRGPVMRYDWRSARRHTEEQRRGWVAHAIAHQKLGHPLRTRHTENAVAVLLALAFVSWAALLFLSVLFLDTMTLQVAVVGLAAVVLLLLGAPGCLWLDYRRQIRTSQDRFKLETDADAKAADVIGPALVLAAIATPDTYPSEPKKPQSQPLPPRDQRRAAVGESPRHV